MSSFQCPKCGADNVDTEQGYVSGCECYSNIDTLEDAVVAKANREYVMVSRRLTDEIAGILQRFDDHRDNLLSRRTIDLLRAELTQALNNGE